MRQLTKCINNAELQLKNLIRTKTHCLEAKRWFDDKSDSNKSASCQKTIDALSKMINDLSKKIKCYRSVEFKCDN